MRVWRLPNSSADVRRCRIRRRGQLPSSPPQSPSIRRRRHHRLPHGPLPAVPVRHVAGPAAHAARQPCRLLAQARRASRSLAHGWQKCVIVTIKCVGRSCIKHPCRFSMAAFSLRRAYQVHLAAPPPPSNDKKKPAQPTWYTTWKSQEAPNLAAIMQMESNMCKTRPSFVPTIHEQLHIRCAFDNQVMDAMGEPKIKTTGSPTLTAAYADVRAHAQHTLSRLYSPSAACHAV